MDAGDHSSAAAPQRAELPRTKAIRSFRRDFMH
jgi:hypothetical protein